MLYSHNLDSAQTGLVFLTTALTYSLVSPVVGRLYDAGLGGFTLISVGSGLVTLGFLAMGPGPLSFYLEVTVISMGLQGIGFSLVYIGSLLTMLGQLAECNLPETEQCKGMVSSLWTVAVCLGQAVGTSAGGIAYDCLGFEWGMLLEALIVLSSIVLVGGIRVFRHTTLKVSEIDKEIS